MLFSRVGEAEHRGSGDACALPPALPLPRAHSQPWLNPGHGDRAARGDRPLAGLLGALDALHHGARMLPRGSCHLCYSQRKRGNLGTKVAELRYSLALLGDTSLGTVSQRGERIPPPRTCSPLSQSTRGCRAGSWTVLGLG